MYIWSTISVKNETMGSFLSTDLCGCLNSAPTEFKSILNTDLLDVQQLLHRIQFHDDESALNQLYRQQFNKLYKYAFSYLGEKEPAEEIVNDLFLKIWIGRKTLPAIKSVNVYLFVAVKNACLNNIRGEASKKQRELQIAESFYFQLSADPAELLIGKQLKTDILNAVNSLPPKCKLIFKMVKDDGLSCKEVAGILGLSNKTVFAQLAIALKKLESVIV